LGCFLFDSGIIFLENRGLTALYFGWAIIFVPGGFQAGPA